MVASQELVRATPLEISVLEALATYRYLTVDQILRLGVSSSRRYLYDVLRSHRQRTRPLIGCLKFGTYPKQGTLPYLYYVTQQGANALLELGWPEPAIHYQRRVIAFHHDYHHRVACVDIHLTFNEWVHRTGGNITRYETYFDRTRKTGKGLQQQTTISWPPAERWKAGKLTADALAEFSLDGSTSRLCAIEYHRGRQAGRLVQQCLVYVDAMKAGAIEQRFNRPAGVVVLILFEEKDTLARFQQSAAQTLPERAHNRFRLKVLDGSPFELGWQHIDRTQPITALT